MIQWCIPNGENQGMRDYIKSEKYFDEFIAEDTARISKLTQKVNGGRSKARKNSAGKKGNFSY